MLQLSDVGSEPRQRFILPVADLEYSVYLTIEYSANQLCWFYSLEAGDFKVYNDKLAIGPNILRQYRGRIPFGLAVLSYSGMDPIVQDAFSSGDIIICVLSPAEVDQMEDTIRGYSAD